MKPRAYYNENDKFAAAWLRELIKRNLIADGDVDERSIVDVTPAELAGYTQCHFFAGIGGWSYALRLAGWPDSRQAWTGSCPCQPYSVASVAIGGAQGQSDERHMWPVWFPLIRECGPDTLFGEQVASAIKWGWLDEAALDLEGEGYAVAPLVLRADAAGANHERRRVYFVAESGRSRRQGHQSIQCVPESAVASFSIDGHALIDARRRLEGDHRDLLPCDGLSVVMERHALRGYGNAIVPQVAAAFIGAYMDITEGAAA